jgi:hypothetical protein
MSKLTQGGVSTTKGRGEEKWEKFMSGWRARKPLFQYDFRDADGELFLCVSDSLKNCRLRRDVWLTRKRLTLSRVKDYARRRNAQIAALSEFFIDGKGWVKSSGGNDYASEIAAAIVSGARMFSIELVDFVGSKVKADFSLNEVNQ